ncbi:hypothetical protein ZEAMMB73_Zm00001d042722 [Zea mays]|uniref:Transducin/WD40 repeat-like superfamily protein n=1 Tax=Zea mays TaxID=4577 RepID=A0A1D6N6E1_MAIZE|nr:hypothetical protein ZEAMMB73_Zm00001d042722 [Zea mays]
MRSTVLVARSLQKASVPPALLSDPTPGSLQPTRLAAHVNGAGSSCSVYLASGCRVYRIEVISSSVVDRCPHRSEIQSVALAEGEDDCLILGTVDSYGHLIVSRLDIVADGHPIQYHLVIVVLGKAVGLGYALAQCSNPCDLIWFSKRTNMCTEYTNPYRCSFQVAVARQLCKTIDIYDQDIHVRSLRTLWYPSSFSFVQYSPHVNESSSLLATAEGSQLSIWDLRMNNNGGCVHRITGSVGDIIYSTCSSPSGLIASGGTDRAVTIYDPRRWSALSRWVGCSKFEITGLAFSSVDESFIYVQGVDYEITCGHWKQSERAFSFRGDSNWLGFSKCANNDVIAGWCESGSIFIADARQL